MNANLMNCLGVHLALPKYTEIECRRYHLTTCVLNSVFYSEGVASQNYVHSDQMIPANS